MVQTSSLAFIGQIKCWSSIIHSELLNTTENYYTWSMEKSWSNWSEEQFFSIQCNTDT